MMRVGTRTRGGALTWILLCFTAVAVILVALAALGLYLQSHGNAYDDFVVAGRSLYVSDEWKQLRALRTRGGPLPVALEQQVVREDGSALRCIHLALARKCDVPWSPDLVGDAEIKRVAPIRELVYVVAYQQDLEFNQGRRDDAIDTLAEGLAIGRKLYQSDLVTSLCGASAQLISVQPTGWHLGELDARHCDRVVEECRKTLALRIDYGPIAKREVRRMREYLDKPDFDVDAKARKWIASDPVVAERFRQSGIQTDYWKKVKAAAVEYASAQYAIIAREGAKPRWKRRKPDFEVLKRDGIGGGYVAALGPVMWNSFTSFDRADNTLKLLATHAGIASYRLEHRVLPPNLGALGLGDLTVDPFAGKPFVYRVIGGQYRLYSVGPNGRDDGGKTGLKFDVFLTPKGYP